MGGHGPRHSGSFQSLSPSSAPFGRCPGFTPSGSDVTSAGRLYATQCTHTTFGAAGSGASGSSTMSAKLFVAAGAPDHESAGETSTPSHVCLRGISPPGPNAVEASLNVTAAGGVVSLPAAVVNARRTKASSVMSDLPSRPAESRRREYRARGTGCHPPRARRAPKRPDRTFPMAPLVFHHQRGCHFSPIDGGPPMDIDTQVKLHIYDMVARTGAVPGTLDVARTIAAPLDGGARPSGSWPRRLEAPARSDLQRGRASAHAPASCRSRFR